MHIKTLIVPAFNIHDNIVIEASERDGVVLPMNLKLGVFSTASVDNIDVNF